MGHGAAPPGSSVPRTRLDATNAAKVATTLQAPTTPSRLLILARLREGPLPATELATAVGMEQSACSHQLRLLRSRLLSGGHLDLHVGSKVYRPGVNTMRISQLAERSGVPASTLRFYETAGLLSAARSPGGYRLYGEEAAVRLAFIGAAKRLGLPLEEIAELLKVWESGVCAEVKADLRPRVAARIADANGRAAELAAFTATLRQALERLDALPDRPVPCDPDCGLLVPGSPVDASFSAGHEALDGEPVNSRAERWRTAPVACSLDGDGVAERTAQWRRLVGDAVVQKIGNGIRLTIPADRATDITALAVAEQRCCPFFDFRLHLDGPVLHLEVRAPDEGAGLLAELFGPGA